MLLAYFVFPGQKRAKWACFLSESVFARAHFAKLFGSVTHVDVIGHIHISMVVSLKMEYNYMNFLVGPWRKDFLPMVGLVSSQQSMHIVERNLGRTVGRTGKLLSDALRWLGTQTVYIPY